MLLKRGFDREGDTNACNGNEVMSARMAHTGERVHLRVHANDARFVRRGGGGRRPSTLRRAGRGCRGRRGGLDDEAGRGLGLDDRPRPTGCILAGAYILTRQPSVRW